MQLSIEHYITHNYPRISAVPHTFRQPIFSLLRRFFHEEQVNHFLQEHRHKENFSFVEAVLDYFDIDIQIKQNELANIPSYGRVVIIANHPLGALDALALMHLLKEIRKDIKIVANAFLGKIPNIADLIIPVDNIQEKLSKESLKQIYQALSKEQAVIIFPSGEVSRARPNGVRDTRWKSGFYKIASKAKAPILPIHIVAKNSKNFYLLSMLNRSLATVSLPHEMFKFRSKKIGFTIGNTIPYESHHISSLSNKEAVKLLRRHFYRIAKGKSGLFKTYNEIALPESKSELKQALKSGTELGATSDGKRIILYASDKESVVLKEIGRLREISFRHVGEGSGKKRDIDRYDLTYQHLVVWDDESLEIAGAYRIGVCQEIVSQEGIGGLYTATLFRFDPGFSEYCAQGIELGRSFVQPKYWNSRALDYLWQGVGAYVRNHPEIRYLFGPVSLSNAFCEEAKGLLIFFYRHYFGADAPLVHHKEPYRQSEAQIRRYRELFSGVDYSGDLQTLKKELAVHGYTIPTLYKQYSEICEEGGVSFMDFGHDKDFNDCVDGFIVADLRRLKPAKRKRYIGA
jgi:1-acyl-sn-glycerol-3-phosphate acyltransferase